MAYVLEKQAPLKKQEKLNRKNKLLKGLSLFFVLAIIFLLAWLIFFRDRVVINQYSNKYLDFSYDSSWTLSKDETSYIALTNKSESLITFKISSLTSKNSNSSIELIADELKYDIEEKNKNYKLLKEEKKNISNNNYEAYKYLYEDGDSQCLIVIMKNENNLFVINYISKNKTFDIVLDSFQYVLSSINLK